MPTPAKADSGDEARVLPEGFDFDAFFHPDVPATVEIDMHLEHPALTGPLYRDIPKIVSHDRFDGATRRAWTKEIHVYLNRDYAGGDA